MDLKLGSHLCELLKVALWCFLEPDTCEGENSLLSTCGELRAPSRALNLKPFEPSIGQHAFLEHLLSVRKCTSSIEPFTRPVSCVLMISFSSEGSTACRSKRNHLGSGFRDKWTKSKQKHLCYRAQCLPAEGTCDSKAILVGLGM